MQMHHRPGAQGAHTMSVRTYRAGGDPTVLTLMPADKRYLSRLEVARIFEVSPHTVYRWTREGRLPYVMTPGGRRRYPREDVERLAGASMRIHDVVVEPSTRPAGHRAKRRAS
ncbi:MAG TPA: helix-turn-helix domain-containing protein [bacterium]|nr:helix-turn-helix domain-containing protein [bacterium]